MNIIINVYFHHTSVILEQHRKTPTWAQEWFQHVSKHTFKFRYHRHHVPEGLGMFPVP